MDVPEDEASNRYDQRRPIIERDSFREEHHVKIAAAKMYNLFVA
jgi:hypothetical protein